MNFISLLVSVLFFAFDCCFSTGSCFKRVRGFICSLFIFRLCFSQVLCLASICGFRSILLGFGFFCFSNSLLSVGNLNLLRIIPGGLFGSDDRFRNDSFCHSFFNSFFLDHGFTAGFFRLFNGCRCKRRRFQLHSAVFNGVFMLFVLIRIRLICVQIVQTRVLDVEGLDLTVNIHGKADDVIGSELAVTGHTGDRINDRFLVQLAGSFLQLFVGIYIAGRKLRQARLERIFCVFDRCYVITGISFNCDRLCVSFDPVSRLISGGLSIFRFSVVLISVVSFALLFRCRVFFISRIVRFTFACRRFSFVSCRLAGFLLGLYFFLLLIIAVCSGRLIRRGRFFRNRVLLFFNNRCVRGLFLFHRFLARRLFIRLFFSNGRGFYGRRRSSFHSGSRRFICRFSRCGHFFLDHDRFRIFILREHSDRNARKDHGQSKKNAQPFAFYHRFSSMAARWIYRFMNIFNDTQRSCSHA